MVHNIPFQRVYSLTWQQIL